MTLFSMTLLKSNPWELQQLPLLSLKENYSTRTYSTQSNLFPQRLCTSLIQNVAMTPFNKRETNVIKPFSATNLTRQTTLLCDFTSISRLKTLRFASCYNHS